MIVTKTINLKWSNCTKQHYKDIGYIFTKLGECFEANVADLTIGCNAKVQVKCDVCGKERVLIYSDAKKFESTGNRCKHCAKMQDASQKRVRLIAKRGSFLDACIDRYGSDFKKKYWSAKNIIDPSHITRYSQTGIWIKCQATDYHDDYLTTCNTFIRDCGCPKCSGNSIHPLDSFGQLIDDMYGQEYILTRWSSKNNNSPYEIAINSHNKVWLICPEGLHGEYEQGVIVARNAKLRCPRCSRVRGKSYIQREIEEYVSCVCKYDIKTEEECSLSLINPISKNGRLRFDIEVIIPKLIIEVHGSQHYQQSHFCFKHKQGIKRTPKEELEYQKLRDKIKKDFVISQGYSYLEVPYWTIKDESYKKLIDDAIAAAQKASA